MTALLSAAGEDGVDLADAAGGQGPAVLAAVAAQPGVEGVQGGGVQPADLEPAEAGQDRAVDVAAVGGHGGRRDRPHAQAPFQPALDQLGHGLGLAAPVLAGGDLGQQLGLDQPGPLHGRPALAGDLAADPALAAGEGVAAGVDLDLEAVAVLALSDHCGPSGHAVLTAKE
jgi:hypothetical protein